MTQKSAAGVGDLVVISNAAVAADSIVVVVVDAEVAMEEEEEVNNLEMAYQTARDDIIMTVFAIGLL